MPYALQPIRPSSVSTLNGDVSILDNGTVEFTQANRILLNDIFSSSYDSYILSINFVFLFAIGSFLEFQMIRADGTKENFNEYIVQSSRNVSFAFDANLASNLTYGRLNNSGYLYNNATEIFISYPAKPYATCMRSITTSGYYEGSGIHDHACTVATDTVYTGIEFQMSDISGSISVFGINQ